MLRNGEACDRKTTSFHETLASSRFRPVNETWIAAAFTPPRDRTATMQQALHLSDVLVDELIQADLIVLGAPMYNFGRLNSKSPSFACGTSILVN